MSTPIKNENVAPKENQELTNWQKIDQMEAEIERRADLKEEFVKVNFKLDEFCRRLDELVRRYDDTDERLDDHEKRINVLEAKVK